jgi:predicted MarR family transcription regulator
MSSPLDIDYRWLDRLPPSTTRPNVELDPNLSPACRRVLVELDARGGTASADEVMGGLEMSGADDRMWVVDRLRKLREMGLVMASGRHPNITYRLTIAGNFALDAMTRCAKKLLELTRR